MQLSFDDLQALVARILMQAGMSDANAAIVARVIVVAERDGAHSHGLFRLPGYVSTLRSGWVDGHATPVVKEVAPSMLHADASNGYAQVALDAVRVPLMAMARRQGVATLCVSNSHHFAALWPDVEPFAEAGFVALTVVNARSRVAVFGARKKMLGTNPMAFACPRANGPPLVWDQASSVMSQGEVLRARQAGHAVPLGVGLDAAGEPSTDPAAILDGGALLPFGAHKGADIALMVEILAAALTGGRFGFEDQSAAYPGAQSSNAGQFLLLIDPAHSAGGTFAHRVEMLIGQLREAGATRLPGEARHTKRAAMQDQIVLSDQGYADLRAMLPSNPG